MISLIPKDSEKQIENVKKSEINKKIEELVNLLKKLDKLKILTYISLKNALQIANYHKGKEKDYFKLDIINPFAEYLYNIILALDYIPGEKKIEKEEYENIIENSKQIFFYVQGYFATKKFSKNESNLQRELRSAIVNHYLYIRGDYIRGAKIYVNFETNKLSMRAGSKKWMTQLLTPLFKIFKGKHVTTNLIENKHSQIKRTGAGRKQRDKGHGHQLFTLNAFLVEYEYLPFTNLTRRSLYNYLMKDNKKKKIGYKILKSNRIFIQTVLSTYE